MPPHTNNLDFPRWIIAAVTGLRDSGTPMAFAQLAMFLTSILECNLANLSEQAQCVILEPSLKEVMIYDKKERGMKLMPVLPVEFLQSPKFPVISISKCYGWMDGYSALLKVHATLIGLIQKEKEEGCNVSWQHSSPQRRVQVATHPEAAITPWSTCTMRKESGSSSHRISTTDRSCTNLLQTMRTTLSLETPAQFSGEDSIQLVEFS